MLYVLTQDNHYRYTVDTTEEQVIEWINQLNWIDTHLTGGWDYEEADVSPPSVILARISKEHNLSNSLIRHIALNALQEQTPEAIGKFRTIEPFINYEKLKQTDTLMYVEQVKKICSISI